MAAVKCNIYVFARNGGWCIDVAFPLVRVEGGARTKCPNYCVICFMNRIFYFASVLVLDAPAWCLVQAAVGGYSTILNSLLFSGVADNDENMLEADGVSNSDWVIIS